MEKLSKTLVEIDLNKTINAYEERDTTDPIEPVSDAGGNASQHMLNLENADFVLGLGIIQDTIPFSYAYRVATRLVGTPVSCNVLQPTGAGFAQCSSCASYTPGTHVLIAYSKLYCHGIILGAYEYPQGLEEFNIKTLLSSVCKRPDEITNKGVLINNKTKKYDGTFNASQLKLEEHTDSPDFGVNFITGMKLFIDPYMALLSSNDYTGITLFESDSLLRTSGINMQQRMSGRENEWLNDEGEYIEYCGSSLHPWEHFGRYVKPGEPIIKRLEEDEWHPEGSVKNFYMPVEDALRPFHRHIDFGGWLGQGKLHQVCSPPAGEIWAKFEKKHKTPCLNRTHEDVAGMLSFMSSKGVSITKSGMTPAAVRLNRPDEIHKSIGDNKDNYSNSNLTLPKDIRTNAENPHMQEVMGIMDYSGYNKNWKDVFQLAYHAGDYYLPEESEMPKKSIQAPHYGQLKGRYMINEDDSIKYKLDIDDRRKQQEFMSNEAGIHILPSGGIVIYDGVGSEIRFINGQLTISCAGDINIKPGRNLHLWSGGSSIIRSGGNVELSSTKGAVRIKAETNLKLLGANDKSESHGVLIESKSSGYTYNYDKMGDEVVTNGVTIKSADSPVTLNGHLVYLRSGSPVSGDGIVIDADHGKAKIRMTATDIDEYISTSHAINYIIPESGRVKSTTFFTEMLNAVVGDLICSGAVNIIDNVMIGGSQWTLGTIHSYGNQSGYITPISIGQKDKYQTLLEAVDKVPREKKPNQYTENYKNELQEPIYAEYHIGNDDLIKKISFSFRTDEQLSLPDDYYVYEDLWQHIVSHSDALPEVDVWGETSVVASAGETYPFPGKKWFTEKKYIRQDPVIADFYSKVYIDRKVKQGDAAPGEGKYADPEYGKQHKLSLNDYIII